jgi:hypothetical protein
MAKAAAYSKDDFSYKKCPLSRAETEYKAHIINTWNSGQTAILAQSQKIFSSLMYTAV